MIRLAPHRLSIASLAVSLLVLCTAPSAGADEGSTVIERCTHGQAVSGFSQQAYRQALQELPTEVEEYSDCANLIHRAQLAMAGGAGGGSSPGSVTPIPLTPAERTALKRVLKAGAPPIVVGSQVIRPGVVHANIASALSSLPDPLLATLAFLLACGLLVAVRALRNRVRTNRSN